MNLKNLIKLYADNGCSKIYIKTLSPNDNSKNQVYLGSSFEILNILPIKDVIPDDSGDWSKTRFKTKLDFHWLSDEGSIYNAQHAQLILYPKYPEVRFSSFLKSCKNSPSYLMTRRLENRLLLMGIENTGKIIGYVIDPESSLANELNALKDLETQGVFRVMQIKYLQDTKVLLLKQLKRIHELGWIPSKRLGSKREILPCNSPNCGGYTLEAELGITPNGYSEPDYLGWEVKQFGVKDFAKYNSSIITLMTPEPTGGYYVDSGVNDFIQKFGYKDKLGRKDRMNFGGIHKVGMKHKTTGLTLVLVGFDTESGKIRNSSGAITLLGKDDVVAAEWSFASLLKHWNRKHNKASYVPSLVNKKPERQYFFGNNIILGMGTDFTFFLKQMALGNIYYDPGLKLENISTKPKSKRRSQFRIKSLYLPKLYNKNEVVNIGV